jgi:hypothetical protein
MILTYIGRRIAALSEKPFNNETVRENEADAGSPIEVIERYTVAGNLRENDASFEQVREEQRRFITSVYGWMCFALLLSGATAVFVAAHPAWITVLAKNTWLFWGIVISQLVAIFLLPEKS